MDLLSLDNLKRPELLLGSRLKENDVGFLVEVLHSVFGDIPPPERNQWHQAHPLAKDLFVVDGEVLRRLFTLAVEIDALENVPTAKNVIDRLKRNELDIYLGARGEIKAGAWLSTGVPSVEFVAAQSKKGKSSDLLARTEWGQVLIEVKSETQFDFPTGLRMFEGWLRGELVRLDVAHGRRLRVEVGTTWVDIIGAACRINPSTSEASWAFHSVIMAASTDASRRIYENRSKLQMAKTIRVEPDLDCTLLDQPSSEQVPVEVIMPSSPSIATLGRIIRDMTNPEYLAQAGDEDFVFFYYTQQKVDRTFGGHIIGNLLLQLPDLEPHCLGVVIIDERESELVTVLNGRGIGGRQKGETNRCLSILRECFKMPPKLAVLQAVRQPSR